MPQYPMYPMDMTILRWVGDPCASLAAFSGIHAGAAVRGPSLVDGFNASTHHMMLRGKPLHNKNDARSLKEKTGEFQSVFYSGTWKMPQNKKWDKNLYQTMLERHFTTIILEPYRIIWVWINTY